MREELLRDAEPPYGDVDFGVAEGQRHRGADAGGAAVVLHYGHQPVFGGEARERRVDGFDPTGVHDRAVDAPRFEELGGLEADGRHHAHRDEQYLGCLRAPVQDVEAAHAVDRRDLRSDRLLREADQGRRVVDGDRFP